MDEQAPAAPTRYRSLDSIRGIAAFIVVLGHCYGILPDEIKFGFLWPKDTPWLFFTNGRAAVMMFFVLSGFVLALPWAEGRPPSYRQFLIRRFCRIYIPFAAAVALAGTLFALVAHDTTGAGDWAEKTWAGRDLGIGALAGHLLMIGRWQDIFLDSPMWTLVHEMRVALFFPLLALMCLDARRGIAAALAIMVLTGAALDSWGRFTDFPVATDIFSSTLIVTFYFTPCFMAGILLAIHRAGILERLAKVPDMGRWALWAGALATFGVVSDFQSRLSLSLAAGTVIMLSLSSGAAAAILGIPVLRWLGRVSYSLYLVHVPIMFAMTTALRGHMPYWQIDLLFIPASLVAAELMCRFVELPSIRLGKRLTAAPGPAARS